MKIVVLSGGMDSGVLLAKLRHDNPMEKIHAITFDYGSNHAKQETLCADLLASRYADIHHVVQLPFIKKLFTSSLLSGAKDIPDGHYAQDSMKTTIVPFRNAIFLSIAVGYAESVNCNEVYIGSHSGDHFIYPDCRPEFNDAFVEASSCGTLNGVKIIAPFSGITKRDLALIGKDLNFKFVETYTCYKGERYHCGECGSCTERREALLGFDETRYE